MSVKKILVIRLSSLGDVVLTTALYPNLKAKFPDSEISVLTKSAFAGVFERNPYVNHVYLFDPSREPFSRLLRSLRYEKFDAVIDLHRNLRSLAVRLLSSAPACVLVEKADLARRFLVWFKQAHPVLDRSVRERILDCLKSLDAPIVSPDTQLFPASPGPILSTLGLDPSKRLIGIAPGARHATKRWPVEYFAEAADRLGSMPNAHVVLLGDPSEKGTAAAVMQKMKGPCTNLAGWTDLKELFAIVSKLELLLTNDSALLHIGEALRIPVVALFGPTVRAFGFAPFRSTSRVVEVTNLPCRPCTLHGDDRCPLKHHRCMVDLDVNAVLLACSDLLEKDGAAA